MRDFFISYTRVDRDWAEWIAATLNEHGYTVFLDAWDVTPGTSFVSWVSDAIHNSKGFIAVLSKEFDKSEHCLVELNAAFTLLHERKDYMLLPVRIEECSISALLTSLVRLDIFSQNEDEAREALLYAVGYSGYTHNRPLFPVQKTSTSSFHQRYLEEILREFRNDHLSYQHRLDDLDEKLSQIRDFLTGSVSLAQINAEHIHFQDNNCFTDISQINANSIEDADERKSTKKEISGFDHGPISSMLREVYHLTKTPLMSIRFALENLMDFSNGSFTDEQLSFLDSIRNDVMLVSVIIGEYRRLATEIPIDKVASSGDNLEALLGAVLASACYLNKKQLRSNITRLPNEISNHGNHFAVILLKPLIDNAVEAAPDGTEITIKSEDNGDSIILTIENYCGDCMPQDENLQTDGFTTKPFHCNGKPGGGEGLSGIRRIAKKHRIGFQIFTDQEAKKVIAILRFPKK